ncbi:hypothetical protein CSC12_0326 [Klebsiella michiganensis]|nr:hypothetical protein CSC12_0326 [Klebsiella michiganensis]
MSGYHRFCFSPRLALRVAGLQVTAFCETVARLKRSRRKPGML